MEQGEWERDDVQISVESWRALIEATSVLEEMFLEDVVSLRRGSPATGAAVADLMPRRFLLKFDRAFAKRLAGTAAELGKKLERAHARGLDYPHRKLLNSVAEEMLMSQAIRMAIDMADSEPQIQELEQLQEHTFEDRDFEWLYNLSHDGVTDVPDIQAMAGFVNLKFEDWFKPFR